MSEVMTIIYVVFGSFLFGVLLCAGPILDVILDGPGVRGSRAARFDYDRIFGRISEITTFAQYTAMQGEDSWRGRVRKYF